MASNTKTTQLSRISKDPKSNSAVIVPPLPPFPQTMITRFKELGPWWQEMNTWRENLESSLAGSVKN